MKYIFLSFMVVLIMFFTYPVSADSKVSDMLAEVVWVEKVGEEFSILHQEFNSDDGWGVPKAVYRSPNSLVTPSIETTKNGGKLLVWTEQFGKKALLMFSGKTTEQGKWSDDVVIGKVGDSNLGAQLLMDWNQNAWVFWTGQSKSSDEIYYSKMNDQSWSKPLAVHQANEVPDHSVQAVIRRDGQVVAKWWSFGVLQNDYSIAERVFNVQVTSEQLSNAKARVEQEMSLDDLPAPPSAPKDARVFVHFPLNFFERSVLYPEL